MESAQQKYKRKFFELEKKPNIETFKINGQDSSKEERVKKKAKKDDSSIEVNDTSLHTREITYEDFKFYKKTGIKLHKKTEGERLKYLQRYVDCMDPEENQKICNSISFKSTDFLNTKVARIHFVLQEFGLDIPGVINGYSFYAGENYLKTMYLFLLAILKNDFREVKEIIRTDKPFLKDYHIDLLIEKFFSKTPKGLLCYLEYLKVKNLSDSEETLIRKDFKLQFCFVKLLGEDEHLLEKIFKEKQFESFQSEIKKFLTLSNYLRIEQYDYTWLLRLLRIAIEGNCLQSVLTGILKIIDNETEKTTIEEDFIKFIESEMIKVIDNETEKPIIEEYFIQFIETKMIQQVELMRDIAYNDEDEENYPLKKFSDNGCLLSDKNFLRNIPKLLTIFSQLEESNEFLAEKKRISFYHLVQLALNIAFISYPDDTWYCSFEEIFHPLIKFVKTNEEKNSPDAIFKRILDIFKGTEEINLWSLLASKYDKNKQPLFFVCLNYLKLELKIDLNDHIEGILEGLEQVVEVPGGEGSVLRLLKINLSEDKTASRMIDIPEILKRFSELKIFDINKHFGVIIKSWNKNQDKDPYWYSIDTIGLSKRILDLLDLNIDITQWYKEITFQWISDFANQRYLFSTAENINNFYKKNPRNFAEYIDDITDLYKVICYARQKFGASNEIFLDMLQITANKILIELNSFKELYSRETLIHSAKKQSKELRKELIGILGKFNIGVRNSKHNVICYLKE